MNRYRYLAEYADKDDVSGEVEAESMEDALHAAAVHFQAQTGFMPVEYGVLSKLSLGALRPEGESIEVILTLEDPDADS